jgi:hypothetical protein
MRSPCFFRIRRTLLPVTCETCAIPCESRRTTPICEGVRPFFASLDTCSTTSLGLTFNHEGGVRRYGRADLEIPFLQRETAQRPLRGRTGEKMLDAHPPADTACQGARARHTRARAGSAHPLLCIRPMAA